MRNYAFGGEDLLDQQIIKWWTGHLSLARPIPRIGLMKISAKRVNVNQNGLFKHNGKSSLVHDFLIAWLFLQTSAVRAGLLGHRERREEHHHDGPGHGHRHLHQGVRLRHRRNRGPEPGRQTLSFHRLAWLGLYSLSSSMFKGWKQTPKMST